MLNVMRFLAFSLIAVLTLVACKKDETVAGYDGNKTWHLTELDGAPYDARATLTFGEDGKVTGKAPCNTYFTSQTMPYPWVGFEAIGSTRMACPDLEHEAAFFNALIEMTQAEVSGDVMLLSNDAGREMLFKAGSDDG